MATRGTSLREEMTERYIRGSRHSLASRVNYVRWIATIAFNSRRGYRALMAETSNAIPPLWEKDCHDKRVLIVGTGPSLEKVEQSFFDRFDTIIYINFALRKANKRSVEYFFSTDLGPVTEWIKASGADPFRSLGRDRCIYAPVFFDQYPLLTKEGRSLFSILQCDATTWHRETVRLGPVDLPLIWRLHPAQPNWDTYRLIAKQRQLPVIAHTSALSAVLFAATHGSKEIGLIGCDFSAGRAASVNDTAHIPTAQTFSGAAREFRQMAAALARAGVTVTNHSWEV